MDIDKIGTQPDTDQPAETQTVLVGAWPLSMVRTISGGYVSVYAEQLVPLDAAPDDAARLVLEGALAEVEVAAEPVALDPQVQAVLEQQSGVIAQLAADRQDQALKIEELTTKLTELEGQDQTAKIEELTSKLAALEEQAAAAPEPAPAPAAGESEKKTSGTSSRSRSS